ncbi:MAG: sigma-54-dependent Fis family transcriptional regulator, partial [Deltaproteobacteria bacterium]|nr:sigma-54-dependent Fis family transcriptional regulator [Deltaproteobacteria bacterium]
MRKIYQLIETIKDSDSHVLISGETGTGKELIANAIHYSSLRRSGTMVSVNCGAIPKELMEREFFGHVKGAYTGAVASRKGYFQEADGGTLFLDEIGEMDRDMQVKLLRVLERGEVVRVGDSAPSQVDVRLVAATNKNLLAEVQQGRFREDLYYRIHVIPIHLPPLRQRREDVPLLVEHFCAKLREKNAKNLPDIDEAQMRIFMDYAYPGNVRELEHMVERFCLLGGIMENLFPAQPSQAAALTAGFSCDELLSGPAPLKAAARLGKAEAEKELIAYALKLCNDDYAETSRRLGIGRSSFYDKLKA